MHAVNWYDFLLQNFQWEFIVQMLAATFCGVLVGFERKRRHKDAGIRTHVLVSVGAALFTIVSSHGFGDDPSRVAANIVNGVGFLGAGVIFLRGRTITGLTTAAGIWTMAAIGMAFGAQMYVLGAVATLLVVLLQHFMHRLLPAAEQLSWQMSILMRPDAPLEPLLDALRRSGSLEVQGYQVTRRGEEGVLLQLTCVSANSLDAEQALRLMRENPDVLEIKG